MKFSSTFVIAASAVLFAFTDAAPMRGTRRGAQPRRAGSPQPPQRSFYESSLQISSPPREPEAILSPPRPGRHESILLPPYGHRNMQPRPQPLEIPGRRWYQRLPSGHANEGANEYGSPGGAHQHGHDAAGPSRSHSMNYASSAPHHSSSSEHELPSPEHTAQPISTSDPRVKNVKIEEVPFAEVHPAYQNKRT